MIPITWPGGPITDEQHGFTTRLHCIKLHNMLIHRNPGPSGYSSSSSPLNWPHLNELEKGPCHDATDEVWCNSDQFDVHVPEQMICLIKCKLTSDLDLKLYGASLARKHFNTTGTRIL
ncbi:uncharacterized protein LOC123564869 [Mercenaria mercenaria]|uniref:uncharacterized protein LOC123564869 n=1 Tax=Mercenaria mercenaria TaxID=6596 RepID=UPI00234E7E23|nr:uncharacterized protein LOC123564869 [Mercenaria mercenaria]